MRKVDIGQEGVRASSKVADVAEDKDVDKVAYNADDMVVNIEVQPFAQCDSENQWEIS